MKDNELKVGQKTPQDWTLSDEEKLNFQSLYILYLITEGKVLFSNFLAGRLKYIQKAIDFLEDQKLIVQKEEFDEKKVLGFTYSRSEISYVYEATQEAQQVIKSYRKRYREYIKLYDVYAYIDPEAGKFALSKYKKHMLKGRGKADWWDYLNDERWEDYRVPVSVYKGLDPREFMFFSFIEEGRFMPAEDDEEHEWAEVLFLGKIWDEMYEILESSVKWEEVAEDEKESAEIMETQIDGLEELYFEKEQAEEEYFEDPIYYHGMNQYTPLGDPLFWLTAAIII